MKRIRCASMGTALILVAAFHSIAFSESDESTPAVEQKADRGETQETFRCNSSKHIVIIDLVNDELRYRAWNKPRPITGKPDIDIGHGTQDCDGTGVCRTCQWSFGKGPVSYIVSEPSGCSDSSAVEYGWLRVEQNGKTISSWSCQHGEEPSQTMKTDPKVVEPTLAVATGTLLPGAQSDDSATGTHIPVSQKNAWISREPGGTGGSWGDATSYTGNWTVNAPGNSGAWSDNNGNSGTWSCNPGEEVEFYIDRTKSGAYRCLRLNQAQPAPMPMRSSAAPAQPSIQRRFGGETALMQAASAGSTDTSRALINQGADGSVEPDEGMTGDTGQARNEDIPCAEQVRELCPGMAPHSVQLRQCVKSCLELLSDFCSYKVRGRLKEHVSKEGASTSTDEASDYFSTTSKNTPIQIGKESEFGDSNTKPSEEALLTVERMLADPSQFIKLKESKITPAGDGNGVRFCASGKMFIIGPDGNGVIKSAGSKIAGIKLWMSPGKHLESAYFLEYENDLLLVYGTADGENMGGYITRVNKATLRSKWASHVPTLNISDIGVSKDGYVYIRGKSPKFNTKINLKSGEHVWDSF